jgi:hypothetical protein
MSLLDYSDVSKHLDVGPRLARTYEEEYEAVCDIIEALKLRAARREESHD